VTDEYGLTWMVETREGCVWLWLMRLDDERVGAVKLEGEVARELGSALIRAFGDLLVAGRDDERTNLRPWIDVDVIEDRSEDHAQRESPHPPET